MKCEEARALFSDFYDRELNRVIRLCVKAHLANCPECKTEYRDFEKSLKILKRLRPLKSPRNYLEEAKKHKRKYSPRSSA